ncbi:hypothetical protein WMF30_08060 [Sorangium sp. So ce134]
MTQAKRRFSYAERYAIWHCNGQKCWWCKEPLRLVEVTIDHVLPESLINDNASREAVLTEYGLPKHFNINGYENWLPCHNHCNQSKSKRPPTFAPGNKAILDGLTKRAALTAAVANSVNSNVAKDKVFNTMFAALEQRTISLQDLHELLQRFVEDPAGAGVPADVIILDSGYWIPRSEIVREGTCRCDRNTCVGHNEKVFCYFQKSLSSWVVNTGLFWRCYDEVISCPRCSEKHERGHVGRQGVCGRPYRSQETQSD